MRTPLGRVRFLGSAHSGTQDFWRQRITGAATFVLAIAAVAIIAAAAGRPYAEAVHVIGSPLPAAVLVLLFIATAVHMRIGMQIIIEDYLDGGLKVVAVAANALFPAAVAVVAIVAVLKLAVGGS